MRNQGYGFIFALQYFWTIPYVQDKGKEGKANMSVFSTHVYDFMDRPGQNSPDE